MATRKKRLLKRKIASREITESISIWLLSLADRKINVPKERSSMKERNPRIKSPRPGSAANEWTEERIPLRTRNVPINEREKARMMRKRFQTLNIFLDSWTITEWRKAVATSHGMKAAFSTGSHPQ